jgi:hemerythrin superfamily protein
MTTQHQQQDVVELLVSQHNTVRGLVEQTKAAAPSHRREHFEALVRLLAVHETAEEEVVYPVVRRRVPDGEAIATARLAEEDQAKKALSGLEKVDPASDDFMPLFAQVETMVSAHAEAEEREVFPALLANQDPEQLVAMGKRLELAEKAAPTHPHAGAPESAMGNMAIGPFVAIADRVRDALRKHE